MKQFSIKKEAPVHGFSHRVVLRLDDEIVEVCEGECLEQMVGSFISSVGKMVKGLDSWSLLLPAFFENGG